MFGAEAFGALPFADGDDPATTIGEEIMIRAATQGGYVDPATHDRYEGRLAAPLRFRRSLIGEDGIGGRVVLGLGDIEFDNADGRYDTIDQAVAVDGGRVLIEEEVDGTWAPIFDGTARDVLPSGSTARLRLRDWWTLTERPLQDRLFGGAGGWDGGEDVANKPLPIGYGRPRNVTPVRIGSDPPRYRYGDTLCGGLDAVYEGGIAWSAGTDYVDAPDVGGFTLAREPAGDITCDFRGTLAADGTVIETTGAVIEDIVGRRLGLSARIVREAFDRFAAAAPGAIDWYVPTDQRTSAADAVAALISGAWAWCGFDALGRFEIGQWSVPVGPAVLTIGDGDLEPGEAAVLPRDLPKGVYPPPAIARAAYDRNWTVQGPKALLGDVLGGDDPIGGARRDWLAEPYRIAITTDPATLAIHRTADKEPKVRDTFFRSKLDAELAVRAWQSLWIGTRGLYDLKTTIRPGRLKLGQVVLLRLRRYGLWDRYGRVAETFDDWGAGKTALTVMI